MSRHTTFTIRSLLNPLKGIPANRILGSLILALTLFTSYSPAQRQAPEGKWDRTVRLTGEKWRTYTGPDKDFTIDFPVEPKRDEYRGKFSTDETGPLISKYTALTDTLMFIISFQDTGYKPNSPFANRISPDFERKVKERYREAGWKIVRIRRLSASVAEVEEWERMSRPSGYAHVIFRTIVRNGQVYDLQCRSMFIGRKVDRDVCRRFLNSFHIVGPPQ